jgi:hypothetical protein
MVIRAMALASAVLALSLGSVSVVAQGKGGKKPSSYPGNATFRCYGEVGECVASDDGVLGQITGQNPEGDYPGTGVPESGRGAHLRTASNELWIGLRDGFTVRLDFSQRLADPTVPCQQGGYCQYDTAFGTATTSLVIGESSYAEIQTNVVDGDDTSVSLLDVSTDPDNPSSVRLLMSFYDSGGKLWNFNFGDHRNSGAENASVYRVANTCTWVFTDGGSLAELSTLVKLQGKQFRSYEGLYAAPFEITFTASQCPAP